MEGAWGAAPLEKKSLTVDEAAATGLRRWGAPSILRYHGAGRTTVLGYMTAINPMLIRCLSLDQENGLPSHSLRVPFHS